MNVVYDMIQGNGAGHKIKHNKRQACGKNVFNTRDEPLSGD